MSVMSSHFNFFLIALITAVFLGNITAQYVIAFRATFNTLSIFRRIVNSIFILFNYFITNIRFSITTWVPIKVSSNNTKEETYLIISQDAVYRSV